MRSSSLVLLLLIGVHAALNMVNGLDQSARASDHKTRRQRTANQKTGQLERAGKDRISENYDRQHHQRTKTLQRASSRRQDESPKDHSTSRSPPDPFSPVVDPKIFSKKRYRSSPRVVFSEVPPSHDAPEDEAYDIEGIRSVRVKRKAGSPVLLRGEFSVCESQNAWVGDLTKATDLGGNEVTVLPNVTINNVVKKQFFYQTTCLSPSQRDSTAARSGRAGGKGGKQHFKSHISNCRGIDSRHWNSYCTNTHAFVSALTYFQGRTAWRYIRINAACVCVLSRRNWSKNKSTPNIIPFN